MLRINLFHQLMQQHWAGLIISLILEFCPFLQLDRVAEVKARHGYFLPIITERKLWVIVSWLVYIQCDIVWCWRRGKIIEVHVHLLDLAS